MLLKRMIFFHCLFTVFFLLATLSHAKEPECPFGSPKIDLADLDGRCDRFWVCEDGLISDTFCPSGDGFDPETRKCHDKAPCLKETSTNSNQRPASLSRIVDILVTKSKPAQTSESKESKLGSFATLITPLILPIIRQFF